MKKQFISYPKSGRTWFRYCLGFFEGAEQIRFHHDQFEFNDGSRPEHNFDFEGRLKKYGPDNKIVFLTRDPRDVVCSLYFQVTGRFKDFFEYEGTISDFIRDDYFGIQNLKRFNEMWSKILEERDFLRVSYEDMQNDDANTIKTVLEYFEIEFNSDQIRDAVEQSQFENMKKIEQSDNFSKPWLRPRMGSQKVRSGKVGGYRETLSQKDIDYLDSTLG